MHVLQSSTIVRSQMDAAHRAAQADVRARNARQGGRARRHASRWVPPLAAVMALLSVSLLFGSLPAAGRGDVGAVLELPRPMAAPAPTEH
jgi:hypothetical protein